MFKVHPGKGLVEFQVLQLSRSVDLRSNCMSEAERFNPITEPVETGGARLGGVDDHR